MNKNRTIKRKYKNPTKEERLLMLEYYKAKNCNGLIQFCRDFKVKFLEFEVIG